MFWNKKTAFQEIVDRWDSRVEMCISDQTEIQARALQNLFMAVTQSAAMIDGKKTEPLVKKGVDMLSNLLRGAYLIGYDFRKKHNREPGKIMRIDDFPAEAQEPIREIALPLMDVARKLVEISHAPGRILLFPENKSEVIRNTESGIITVAAAYFKDGMNQAEKS